MSVIDVTTLNRKFISPKIAFLLLMLLILAVAKIYYHQSLGLLASSPNFLVYSLYGVFALHFSTSQSAQERVALTAALFGLILLGYLATSVFFLSTELSLCVLAGYASAMSSVLTHAFLIIIRRRSWLEAADLMTISWIFVLAAIVSPLFLNVSGLLYPTYDPHLFRFEAGLGIRIEAVVSWLVTVANPFAGLFLNFIYLTLWLAVVLHFALAPFERPAMPILAVVCGIVGYSLFLVYPVVGPDFIPEMQDQGIWTSSLADQVTMPASDQLAGVPRNCMPSLHCAWAYLLIWNSRSFARFLRWCVYAFAALTVLSAFEVGRHWFIDVIIAFPLAAAVQALCDARSSLRDSNRLVPLLGGSLLVALWFVALRSDWFVDASPGLLRWIAILATVILPVYLLNKFKIDGDTYELAPSFHPAIARVSWFLQ
jgi:hypothetical protein